MKLNKREKEIGELLLKGLTNDQIADDLGIKSNTVKVVIRNLRYKMQCSNRTQLAITLLSKAEVE